jgi:hypothetical protein
MRWYDVLIVVVSNWKEASLSVFLARLLLCV